MESELVGVAFAMLVITWYAPQVGWTLAGIIAFVSFPMMCKDLTNLIDPPRRIGDVARGGPTIGWWLIGLGLAGVMFALGYLARRRQTTEGVARAVLLR
jgi:hypothetical protein